MQILAYSHNYREILYSRRGLNKHLMDGYNKFLIPEGHYNQTSEEAVHILMEIKRK